MIKQLIGILTLVITGLYCPAQDLSFCGSLHDKASEKFLDAFFSGDFENKSPMDLRWVPMTVHIVGPSGDEKPYYNEKDVIDALCTLNDDFSESFIQFYLSEIRYIFNDNYFEHNFTNGIQMMNVHNVWGTANTYFVENAANNCGYFAPSGGAVAVAFSCAGVHSHTWAHEMGHYFSLPHTFRGWEGEEYEEGDVAPTVINNRQVELAVDDDDCEISGDRFCDTPADYLSFRWNCNGDGESSIVQTDPNEVEFRSDGTYFMSYSNDGCMNKFSPLQMDAMLANLETTKGSQINHDYSFIEIDPEKTFAVSPDQNDIISSDQVTLKWESSDEAIYYYIELSRLPGFQIVDKEEIVQGNELTISNLKLDKNYYWRITPYGSSDFCSSPGAVNTFTTPSVVNTFSEELIDFNMYPNPSHNVLNLSSNTDKKMEWSVYNSLGIKVYQSSFSSFQQWEHNLNQGIYIIEIKAGEKKITKKFIVQ